jgi:hypothetical protein
MAHIKYWQWLCMPYFAEHDKLTPQVYRADIHLEVT